jgi:hypothetical protein
MRPETLEAKIGLYTGAMAQAIHDANLLSGAMQIMDFFTAVGNPEKQ